MAASTSRPSAAVCSAMAIELVETIVPICAMLRRSLSSEAAASLITALTRAASAMGSLRPPSNQRVACSAPPRSMASSRMIREETMSTPIAALAIVLAIAIRARSSASGGRSSTLVFVTKRASSPAMLIDSSSLADPGTLFRSEHLDGDTASVYRAGPTGIERHVGDQPLQLGLRHPVVERPLHMAPHLVGPVQRRQHCHRDQAPVTLAEVGMLPYVAEQHVVTELPQLGNELVHGRLLLSHVSISYFA